jgi:cyclase
MERRKFLISSALTASSLAFLGNKSLAAMLAAPDYKLTPFTQQRGHIYRTRGHHHLDGK